MYLKKEVWKGALSRMKKFLILFMVAGLSILSAQTFKVDLFQPSYLAGKELQPGQYKVEQKADKVVFMRGGQMAEAIAKAESTGKKYSTTTLIFAVRDGKQQIREIRLGGTDTKLVLD